MNLSRHVREYNHFRLSENCPTIHNVRRCSHQTLKAKLQYAGAFSCPFPVFVLFNASFDVVRAITSVASLYPCGRYDFSKWACTRVAENVFSAREDNKNNWRKNDHDIGNESHVNDYLTISVIIESWINAKTLFLRLQLSWDAGH